MKFIMTQCCALVKKNSRKVIKFNQKIKKIKKNYSSQFFVFIRKDDIINQYKKNKKKRTSCTLTQSNIHRHWFVHEFHFMYTVPVNQNNTPCFCILSRDFDGGWFTISCQLDCVTNDSI